MKIGTVVIGRNEGDRLLRCLSSVPASGATIVYVDSGSSDGSVERAAEMSADVVRLDAAKPFTAARARNAGWRRLEERHPDVEAIQFIDGDCELASGWVDEASAALAADSKVAAVCGDLLEREPGASIYNRLCAMEWKGVGGDVAACGGIALHRVEALRGVGGFREDLIAGEEPELCFRLRQAGWRIQRLDRHMATHDAAMTRLGQWWRRSVRSGHAYAESAWLHRSRSERPWRREVRRNWFWGLMLPGIALGFAWPTYGLSLLLLCLYPVWMLRIVRYRKRTYAEPSSDALIYALFCMLGKFPAVLGQLKFVLSRLAGRRTTLIEYKGMSAVSPEPAGAQT